MGEEKYKQILRIFFSFGLLLLILLSIFSVYKPKAIRHIENKASIRLPKGTEVVHSEFRGFSFHGDGDDIILLQLPQKGSEEFLLEIQQRGWGEIDEEAYALLSAGKVAEKYNFFTNSRHKKNVSEGNNNFKSLGWVSFDKKLGLGEVSDRYNDAMVALYNTQNRKLLFVHHNV